MGLGHKEFVASKLDQLYDGEDYALSPVFRLSDDRAFGLSSVYASLIEHQPYVARCKKSVSIVEQLIADRRERLDSFEEVTKKMSLNAAIGTVHAKFVKLIANERVQFRNACAAPDYRPPSMRLVLENEDISTIGTSYRVNTGYIVQIPLLARPWRIEEGPRRRLLRQKVPTEQRRFVVLPRVDCNPEAQIQVAHCPIDPDNTGLCTINFVLLDGTVKWLRVSFWAIPVDANRTNAGALVDPGPNAVLFKPRDSGIARLIKNPRAKIAFETARRDDDGALICDTFNPVVEPKTISKQRVRFDAGVEVLMVSRKREWLDKDLITVAGVGALVPPRVYCANKNHLKNTHGLVMIQYQRVALFSESEDLSAGASDERAIASLSGLRVINGAFSDTQDYRRLVKAVGQIITSVVGISAGDKITAQIAGKYSGMTKRELMRVYDYQRVLHDNEARLRALLGSSDEELSASYDYPLSVVLHRGLSTVIGITLRDQLTPAELASIGVAKRGIEDDGSVVVAAKRPRGE